MEKEKFIQLVKQPQLLDDKTLQKLKEIRKRYPYFQTAHILYLKNVLNAGSNAFREELEAVAPHIQDKARLYDFLNDIELQSRTTQTAKEPVQDAVQQEKPQHKEAGTEAHTAEAKEPEPEAKPGEKDDEPREEKASAEQEKGQVNFDDLSDEGKTEPEVEKKDAVQQEKPQPEEAGTEAHTAEAKEPEPEAKPGEKDDEPREEKASAEQEKGEVNFDDLSDEGKTEPEVEKKEEDTSFIESVKQSWQNLNDAIWEENRKKEEMPEAPEEKADQEETQLDHFQDGWKKLTQKISDIWDKEAPEKEQGIEEEEPIFREGWNELVQKIKTGWEGSTSYLEYGLEEKPELFKEGWNLAMDKLNDLWTNHKNELNEPPEDETELAKEGWKKAAETIQKDKDEKKLPVSTQSDGIKEVKNHILAIAEKLRSQANLQDKAEAYQKGWGKAMELLESTKSVNLEKLSEKYPNLQEADSSFLNGWNDVIDSFQYLWLQHTDNQAKELRSKQFRSGWDKIEERIKLMDKAAIDTPSESTDAPKAEVKNEAKAETEPKTETEADPKQEDKETGAGESDPNAENQTDVENKAEADKSTDNSTKEQHGKDQRDAQTDASNEGHTSQSAKSGNKQESATAADAILNKINRIKQSRQKLNDLEEEQKRKNEENAKKKR